MVGIYHKLYRSFLIQPKNLQTFPDLGFCFKFENQPGIVERFRNIFKLAMGLALGQTGCVSKPCEWFLNDEKQWISPPVLQINQNQQWLGLQKKIPTRSRKLRDFSSKVSAIRSCRSHVCFSSCRATMKIDSSSFWAGTKQFLLLLYLAPGFCWKCFSPSNGEFLFFPKINLVRVERSLQAALARTGGWSSPERLVSSCMLVKRAPCHPTHHLVTDAVIYFYTSTVIKIPWQELKNYFQKYYTGYQAFPRINTYGFL